MHTHFVNVYVIIYAPCYLLQHHFETEINPSAFLGLQLPQDDVLCRHVNVKYMYEYIFSIYVECVLTISPSSPSVTIYERLKSSQYKRI